jgi:hypothetical protein
METIKAKYVDDQIIVLASTDQLEKVYGIILKEEDFIIEWKDKEGTIFSKVIIGSTLISKVRTGDITLNGIEIEVSK